MYKLERQFKGKQRFCDNPDCNHSQIVEARELPNGFTGTVIRIEPFHGSESIKWFAHEDACIVPAIMEAIDREYRNE